jgi:DNA gyrase/topoisomerase IV subunit A
VDDLPDARDGLTRLERIILWQLHEVQNETGRQSVPTAMLYGRVVQHIDVSVAEFQRVLQKLVLSDRSPP